MTAQMCLPLTGATQCGYCTYALTLQPEGDWACSPCRAAMKRTITAADYPTVLAQFRQFQREAARRAPNPRGSR